MLIHSSYINMSQIKTKKRITVKTAKMVGSSCPLRARIAQRFDISRRYIQTAMGVIVIAQDVL